MPAARIAARIAVAGLAAVLLLAALLLAAAADTSTADTSTAGDAGAPTPLVVVSWDGAGDVIVDRLLAEGRLPHLAALKARGVAARYSVTCQPSKTSAGHATLWTGAPPAVHGVTSNQVPLFPTAEHTVLESIRGFDSAALTAEPLWVTAAKAGRRVVLLSATQSYPAERWVSELAAAGVPADRFLSFSGFEHPVAGRRTFTAADLAATDLAAAAGWNLPPERRQAARELAFEVGGCDDARCRFYALVEPAAPGSSPCLLVRQGSRAAGEALAEAWLKPEEAARLGTAERTGVETGGETELAPRPLAGGALDATSAAAWSPPFQVARDDLARGELEANTFFRLFRLAADGSDLLLYQRPAFALRGAHTAAQRAEYLAAYPGFHDDAFRDYEEGLLGTPLPAGGDGVAEDRLLDLVAFDLRLAAAGSRFALRRWQPDLLLHYTPLSDSAGHTWWALFDASDAGYDAPLAARMWPFYARVFELQDAWLGEIVAAAPRAVVAVVSDHGMSAVRRYFFVNRALADAGLLVYGDDGQADLARSRAVAPFPEFGVRVNGVEWRDGVVAPPQRAAVATAIAEALLAVVDPETGRRPVVRVFRPQEAPGLGLPLPPRGADVYYDLAPGYYTQPWPSPVVAAPSRLPWGEGHHGYWPERRDMHAIFYAAGPGLARGVDLGPTRHVDVAPTLCRAVGLPAPAEATGHVLAEALAAANGG